MDQNQFNRRDFFVKAGIVSLGFGCRAMAWQQPASVVEIRIARNEPFGLWYFEPLGVYLEPGQTVRWRNVHWGPTVTAYHPDYDNRELRIPEEAAPFSSGILGDEENTSFEWRFEQEGTYDYCSRYQEVFGMVGRIVVGHPGGPGENPLGYGARQGRAPVYRQAIQVLEYASSSEIMKRKKIPFPVKAFGRRY